MGIFDKKKTFTDLQIVNLLEPDAAQRSAKLSGMYYTDNMGDFNMMYWNWKRDYRHRYSAKYLQKSGFVPQSDASFAAFNPGAAFEIVHASHPEATGVVSSSLGTGRANDIGRYIMQYSEHGWDNATSTAIISGVTYTNFYATFTDESHANIKLEFSNVNNDYVTFETSNQFGVSSIAAIVYTTNEPGKTYYHIQGMASIPTSMYSSADMEMMAVIPIKENDEFVHQDLKMRRLLNKYGLSGDDLIDSLTEDEEGEPSKIDNAYIWNGIGFRRPYQSPDAEPEGEEAPERQGYYHKQYRKKNNYYAEGLFKTFEFFGEGFSGTKFFEMAELDLQYEFNYQKLLGNGNANGYQPESIEVGPTDLDLFLYPDDDGMGGQPTTIQGQGVPFPLKVGEYYSELVEDLEYDDLNDANHSESAPNKAAGSINSQLYIYHQIDANNYEVIKITNYKQTFVVSGYHFEAFLDSLPEEGRLIMPLSVMNDLKFNRFIVVHEFSFSMIAYAKETVTIKWYQRWFFQFLFAVVIGWLTAGAGTAFITVLVNTAISFGIGLILSQLLSAIDNPVFRAILGVIAGILAGGGINFADLTVENFLPLATKVVNAGSTIYEAKIQEVAEETARKEEQQGYEDREAKRHEATTSFPTVMPMSMDAHMTNEERFGSEAFYRRMLGEGLFDFEQYYNVDLQIETRKQVKSG